MNNEKFNNGQSNLDTFELATQTMKTKTSRTDSREKANRAIDQAMFIARTGRGNNSDVVAKIIQDSKDNAKAKQVHEPIRFSGKCSFGMVYGNAETDVKNIKAELAGGGLTKTRAKKLRKQLRDAEAKLAKANEIENLSK